MEFLILGPLEVSDDGRKLALGGPKQRAVLAHLILRANRVVPADLLIDGLWGEDPPESARNTLQTYVYRLRKLLGEGRIEGRNGGYVLTAAPEEIDAARFEALVKQGKGRVANDPAAAASELDEGLALWRGEALANLADESSLRGEIARLEELRLAATEHRIAAEIAMGGHSTVVSELESLTARYPLRERMWANLMLALYRSGRQAEALDAYQRARQVLLDELGADPSPQLQHLNQQMLDHAPDLLGRSAPKPPTTVRHSKGDLPPGTEFAGYRIEAVLGRGGMSVVYLAEHLALGRKVALKLLAPQLADDDRFRERFVRESRIAAGMEHPNIVPIYEAGEAEGFLFIAMRYVPGTDLGRLIRREGTLDPGRALWIVRETASALDAAHGRGLVHRDVKPGNILVVPGEGSEGRDLVYLSDFGLTKRLESGTAGITQTGQFVGTVDYVAPEQIEGKRIDARADVYALACVLFECLTGRVPYERDTQVAALYAHLGEKPPPLTISRPDLPATIDAVVAKALSKTSEGRYATCGEFATAVRGTLGPLAGEPTPTADRSGWSRWQAGAVALVAALIAGVVVFSVFRGETPTAEDAASSPTPTMSLSPAPDPTFRTVERSLTTDEQRLLTSIPEDVGADCLPLDRAEPVQSELAALVCRNDDVEVLYELFPNRDLMDEAFQSNANINRAPEGECATDHLAVTPYTIGGEPAGRVLCYTAAIDANNQAGGPKTRTSHIEWTDENSAIYAHAIRNDLGDLTLYEWWLSSSGPLVSAEVGSAMAKDRPAAAAGRRLPEGSYLVSVDEPFERVSEVDLVAGNGGSLVTYRIHLEAGMYELARNGVIFDAGDILFEKPNLIVFDPLSGQCVGNEFSGQPSSYEWSASGSSLRWKLTEGTCAGPDQVPGKIAWTRAPSGVIAFSTQGQIFLMDAAGFNVEKLTGDAETGPNVSPTWSPDGTRIAFAGAGPEGFDLYSMNADGSGLEQLTDEAGDEIHPAFSPDGSRIAFAVDDPGVPPFRTSIVVVDPDGGDSTELTGREDEHVGWPVWSPDGRRIAFVGVTDRFNIYVMHADGSHVTKVHEEPRGPSFGLPLSWTPDGKRIVFWSERGKGTLLLMRPDGSDVREFVVRFPRSPYIGELVPDWSPDGRWIVMAGSWAPQALPQDLGTLVLLMRADGSEVFTVGYYVTEPSWRPP